MFIHTRGLKKLQFSILRAAGNVSGSEGKMQPWKRNKARNWSNRKLKEDQVCEHGLTQRSLRDIVRLKNEQLLPSVHHPWGLAFKGLACFGEFSKRVIHVPVFP